MVSHLELFAQDTERAARVARDRRRARDVEYAWAEQARWHWGWPSPAGWLNIWRARRVRAAVQSRPLPTLVAPAPGHKQAADEAA